MVKSKSNKGDIVLSIAVCIQYFLIILQQCLISILHMEPESTTIYRVVLSALPVLFAFYYILKREFFFTLQTYALVGFILVLHSAFFPENIEYIEQQAFRFLLPVCLPTMLAMRVIHDFDVFKTVLVYVSWATIFLLLIYMLAFLQGSFLIESYNMSFGYGLLLPTLIMYNEKTKITFIAFIFSLFSILSLGSRGPVLIIGVYVVYDIFINHKKYIPLLLGGVFVFMASLMPIVQYLDSIGIQSRTLHKMISGDIDGDSGRGDLYAKVFDTVLENPILGLGVYGDRVILNGAYCHNIIVEMMVNWGIPLAILLMLVFAFQIFEIYKRTVKEYRNILVLFLCSSMIHLFLSNSYLSDASFFAFVGLVLFYRRRFVGLKI